MVHLTPAEPTAWTYADGLLQITIDTLAIHCAIEIE
jgi:hypothetical protein